MWIVHQVKLLCFGCVKIEKAPILGRCSPEVIETHFATGVTDSHLPLSYNQQSRPCFGRKQSYYMLMVQKLQYDLQNLQSLNWECPQTILSGPDAWARTSSKALWLVSLMWSKKLIPLVNGGWCRATIVGVVPELVIECFRYCKISCDRVPLGKFFMRRTEMDVTWLAKSNNF